MQIGIVGLGRMGGNITRRLMRAGHQCVVFDANVKPREKLAEEGATAVNSLERIVKVLAGKPRAVWMMLPAGRITEETVEHLGRLLEPDDIVIDGGNSYYKDDIRRAKKLSEKRIRYVDCGTSGGVWGLERGYCMMIGGPSRRWITSTRFSRRSHRDWATFRAHLAAREATRGRSGATSMPVQAGPGIS
jgi:6-phosphogluconate dehydrogenase